MFYNAPRRRLRTSIYKAKKMTYKLYIYTAATKEEHATPLTRLMDVRHEKTLRPCVRHFPI